MGLADTKKRMQTVAMEAPRTIRAETVANRPRPDPPPPIRDLWRGRRCSKSSARPPPPASPRGHAGTLTRLLWRPGDLPAPTHGGHPCLLGREREGGGGVESKVREGYGGGEGAMLGFRRPGRVARLGLHLLCICSMCSGSEEGEARRRRGSGRREEAEGRGRQWNRVWGSFYTKQTQF
jgi:hypothetical protein